MLPCTSSWLTPVNPPAAANAYLGRPDLAGCGSRPASRCSCAVTSVCSCSCCAPLMPGPEKIALLRADDIGLRCGQHGSGQAGSHRKENKREGFADSNRDRRVPGDRGRHDYGSLSGRTVSAPDSGHQCLPDRTAQPSCCVPLSEKLVTYAPDESPAYSPRRGWKG